MVPRDHYANFSAVIYQNLGTSLAPLAGLLGAFVPNANQPGHANPLNALSNMKPMMLAAYGEPDRLTVAGSSNCTRRRAWPTSWAATFREWSESGSIRSNDGNTGTAKSVSLE